MEKEKKMVSDDTLTKVISALAAISEKDAALDKALLALRDYIIDGGTLEKFISEAETFLQGSM